MEDSFKIKYLKKNLADNANDLRALTQLGKIYAKGGEFKEAKKCFERALVISPNLGQLRFHLGLIYARLGDYEYAVSEWRKIIDEDGDLQLQWQEFDIPEELQSSLEAWEKLAEKPGKDPFQYFISGAGFYFLGKPEKAISPLKLSLKISPDFKNSWLFLGLCYLRLKRYEEAVSALENELKGQDTHWLNFYLGLALQEAGKIQAALLAFKKALKLKPRYFKALYQTGKALREQGDYTRSEEFLQEAVKLAPDRPLPYLELGRVYEKQFKMDKAVERYEQVVKLAPDLKAAHFQLALLKRSLGRAEEAVRHFQKVLELDPLEAEVYYYLGLLYHQMGKYPEAIKNLKRVLEFNPRHSYAHYTLGCALVASGELEEAVARFEKAGELNPGDHQIRTALGEAFIRMGNAARAVEEFNKIIQLNPQDLYTRYYLGIAHLRMGEMEPAIEQFKQTIEKHPDSVYARFSMGAACIYSGDFDKATREFQKASELLPSSEKDLELFATLQLLSAMGVEFAKAGAQIRKLYQHLNDAYIDTVKALAQTIDARDKYTQYHSSRVATISAVLAEAMGFPPQETAAIEIAGYLHDVGKIGISDYILLKEGSLTPEEAAVIRGHPVIGYNILKGVRFPWNILPLIKNHHERYDGSGYPDGLKGDHIPIGAQIIHLADYYDALITDRPYRKSLSSQEALEEMEKQRGKHFPPQLLDTFKQVVDKIIPLLA